MKRLAALIMAAVSVFSVFALSACSSSDGVSESTLEKIKNSQSDKIDLAAWTKAMTSEDIYNSTAVCKESYKSTYVSDSSTSVYTTEATYTSYTALSYDSNTGKVTGKTYNISETSETTESDDEVLYYYVNAKTYIIIDDTTGTLYAETGDTYTLAFDNIDSGVYGTNIISETTYVHLRYSDGNFEGCAYSDFTYDDELGSYVYEFTSGNYTYEYELKFSDNNITYCKIYSYYYGNSTSYSRETASTYEYYFIYDAVEITIPDSVQKKIDSLSENI